jgi:hypothetical protein
MFFSASDFQVQPYKATTTPKKVFSQIISDNWHVRRFYGINFDFGEFCLLKIVLAFSASLVFCSKPQARRELAAIQWSNMHLHIVL